MKATTFYEKQANGYDNKTSETEAFESMGCYSLAAQWNFHLRLSKMPATCFTHTYFDTIKLLQYFRHFHAAKPGKILTASKEVSAKGELLIFGIYRSAITYSPFE